MPNFRTRMYRDGLLERNDSHSFVIFLDEIVGGGWICQKSWAKVGSSHLGLWMVVLYTTRRFRKKRTSKRSTNLVMVINLINWDIGQNRIIVTWVIGIKSKLSLNFLEYWKHIFKRLHCTYTITVYDKVFVSLFSEQVWFACEVRGKPVSRSLRSTGLKKNVYLP